MQLLLANETRIKGACFDMLVQPQNDACQQPIEDPTIDWGPTTTWIKVATINIPPQEILHRDMLEFCDAMTFTPWNSLEDHRPLGGINLARKAAYFASAKTRLTLNHAQYVEPTGEEKFSGALLTNSGAGDITNYEFATYDPPFQTLPKHVKVFPQTLEDFGKIAQERMFNMFLEYASKLTLKKIIDATDLRFENFKTPNDYVNMFTGASPLLAGEYVIEQPEISKNERWKLDAQFARQWISGVNPMTLVAVERGRKTGGEGGGDLPRHVLNMKAVYERHSESYIERLIDDHRLFYASYPLLDQTVRMKNSVFYAPVVVLYLDEQEQLMPLFVQLTRLPDKSKNKIYFPQNDDPTSPEYWGWMFVKMHVMNADSMYHEAIYHLGYTHLAAEPVIISFHRQLSLGHPLLALLEPHFNGTLAINDLGRKDLISPNGVFDQIVGCGLAGTLDLINKAYANFSWTERAVPKELARRGFYENAKHRGSPGFIPEYWYREYGLKIWYSIEKYVTTVVDRYYGNPNPLPANSKVRSFKSLKDDEQLKALEKELRDPAYGGTRGVPSLTNRDSLIEFLTTVLFTCSAQHSAVNFGQYDYYGFVPNRPFGLTKAVPDDLTEVDEAYIMEALPNQDTTITALSITRFISLPPYYKDLQTQKETGATLLELRDPKLLPEYEQFRADLNKLQTEIKTSMDGARYQWPYLLPSRIAASTSI